MSRPLPFALFDEPRSELAMLLLASFAVVTTILLAVFEASSAIAAAPKLQGALLVSIVFTAAAGAGLVWLRKTRAPQNRADVAVGGYDARRDELSLEAIVAAEPQVLAFWEAGSRVRIVSHTLRSVAGVPQTAEGLEALGHWLDAASLSEMKRALDLLFIDGLPFTLILKTQSGGNFEAEGATAGGRALLRLRDLVGYKRDLATVLDQNRLLARDVAAQRLLLDALPNAVWFRSPQGQMVWANKAYLAQTDGALADGARHLAGDIFDKRQADAVQRSVIETGRYVECLSIGQGNDRIPHDITVLASDGGLVGLAIDATAAETVHDELVRQVAAYDRTLHGVATGTTIFGSDGRLSFYNTAWHTLFEIDADWLATAPTLGEVLDRLNQLGRLPFVGDYRDWRRSFLDAVAGLTAPRDEPINHEAWWHLFDGRTIRVTTERQVDGTVVGLFDDVTQNISLESRYNELIATQRETLDTLKEAVAVFGPNGRLRLFNTAFVEAWRLSRAMLAEGPHIEEIFKICRPMTEDDRPWARLATAVTSLGDDRGAIEGQFSRRDGSVYDYAASPLPDGATLLTFFDVTKAKSYERALTDKYQAEMGRTKALQQANEALTNADRLKSQLISHVSYEFRTPLTTILGYAEFMAAGMTGSLNARQHESIDAITSAGTTLLAIFDDILDLALIDAGSLELKRAPVAVGHIIAGAIEAVTPRAEANGIILVLNLPEPDAIIVADDARVRQILFNLLSNAIGFSTEGSTVTLSALSTPEATVLTVSDLGVGIPPAIQDRMFERFESRSQGSSHRGAGLGLAVVRSLVALHGGQIRVESTTGIGTTISVELPRDGHHVITSRPASVRSGEQLALPLFSEAG